jgi:hypothetical protein
MKEQRLLWLAGALAVLAMLSGLPGCMAAAPFAPAGIQFGACEAMVLYHCAQPDSANPNAYVLAPTPVGAKFDQVCMDNSIQCALDVLPGLVGTFAGSTPRASLDPLAKTHIRCSETDGQMACYDLRNGPAPAPPPKAAKRKVRK